MIFHGDALAWSRELRNNLSPSILPASFSIITLSEPTAPPKRAAYPPSPLAHFDPTVTRHLQLHIPIRNPPIP